MNEGTIIAQRYRLGRKLGEGGMGTVYAAEHVVTGRQIAVKVLEHRDKLPPESVDRFLREARAPAAIRHPNVVEVLDAGTEPDGTPFIAMELLEGETLEDVLRRDKVVQPRVLATVMDQLLAGLDAMHARGFVHRDLKPANIFLVYSDDHTIRVKLLDFGIAKALGEDSRTRSGYVIGTPAYMAPEQMRNARNATARSDLWSVGIMLYEALVGHRPFRGATFGLLAMIAGPVPATSLSVPAPHLPAELAALVDRLLAKDSAQRPASAADVRRALVPLLARCPPVRPIAPPPDPDEDESAAAAVLRDELAAAAASPSHASRRDDDDDDDDDNDAAAAARASRPFVVGDHGVDPTAATSSEQHRVSAPFAFAGEASASPDASAGDSAAIPLARRRGLLGDRRVQIGIALGAVTLAVAAMRLSGGGTRRPPPTPSTRIELPTTPVAGNTELAGLVNRWIGTLSSQRPASLAPFYTDQVRFRGSRELASPAAIQRYYQNQIFGPGGSFAIDWARSTWAERPADMGAGVAAACINVAGASGRVIQVRAWATELMPNRSDEIGCARLDGVYLLELRRVNGALQICHETWSMRDGICASCPTAPACQNGGAARP